jgi:dihydrofolate synthase / folylpolyglutamate synthase
MISTYPQAVQYLYDNLPMFQRVGTVAFKKDLTNTIKLCEFLGNPHKKIKSVHIGGTNGKGSSSHMLASVLQAAGYKTGLYTSPHLKQFTERIRVNGEEVTQQFVVDFVNRIRAVIEDIKPSFFEITVAMAFEYFASQQVDVAVIEVGLGGRLDSTNVITPSASLITNISYDHKDILGNTLQEIASEKAGIIKKGIPVVISERQPEVEGVFVAKANETGSAILFASDQYDIHVTADGMYRVKKEGEEMGLFDLPLHGFYQQKNLAGVLAVIDILNRTGFSINKGAVAMGLHDVISYTKLKGRWQKLQDNPLVICDTGHNLDGVSMVLKQIKHQSYKRLWMVWGMVKDKDINDILQILPSGAYYFFTQAKIPRALDAAILAERATAFGLKGEVVPDVNDAIEIALQRASKDDLIFIGGSTFVVAEIRNL